MSCKTINIDLANVPPVPLQIGVAGENAFRTITFDASKWGADYPDATYTVVYRRADGYMYPVLVNAAADGIVWNPTDTDTAVSGNGQLEVRLLDGETIGKTIIMQTFVAPSLTGDESEPSTPAPDWVNDVADDADRAEAAVEHYPQIRNGYWWVWDVESSAWVNTGVKASGEGGGSAANAVLYTAQTLTDAQKEQARENVGAASMSDIPSLAAYRTASAQDAIDAAQDSAIAAKYTKPSGGIPASDLASGVIPFEIPFVKQSDESWVFDPNSTLTSEEIFEGIKNAQGRGGVVAKVTTSNGDVLFYRALDALAEDGEPEDDPAALAEFIEFPFGDNYYYLHYIQVNPYSPDSDYWIETESNRTNFAQSTYVDSAIASALASTQTYFVRGIASAASLLTSSSVAVSYADLVNAQAKNNNVEITAAMFDLNYNARFKISEMLFSSQTGKSTVVLTDVTATQVVVVTLIGTGETGALTGTVTTTPILTASDVQTAISGVRQLPTVTASDNGKFLRVVNGAWAAETVQTFQGGSY